ncbi:MAG: gene transfer agent family protein [Sphingomonadales bacterium]|nr:MAG: gene transfer agent family protein [Sphingomonadales bacterium]
MIKLAGRSYLLRPSFEALVLAEEELGSLFALVERAGEGALTLSEMASLLWHCLPDGNRPSREQIGEAMLEMGLVKAAEPVRAILAQILKGRA